MAPPFSALVEILGQCRAHHIGQRDHMSADDDVDAPNSVP